MRDAQKKSENSRSPEWRRGARATSPLVRTTQIGVEG